EGPPGIPPGGTTGQYLAKKSDQSYDVEWKAGGGGTGEAAWGDVSGDITAQTDLQTALDAKADNDDLAGKADVNHSHSVEEVIGLTNALAQKQPVGDYATNDDLAGKVDDDDPRLSDSRDPNNHTHPVADIDATGTPSSDTYLRGDGTWATPATGGTGASNWGELGGDIADQTDLQQALDAKQDAGDYATNSDLTNGLAGKADATHEHAISDVTGLQGELDGKQDAGDYATNSDLTTGLAGKANSAHSHASTDITDFNTAVDARIENVVGAAPEALDTLAEIAESLNNDEDFAGTMTTQLAGKADAAHGHAIAD